MARDITVDIDINPVLNQQATKNVINSLEKELRSVHTGQHLSTARKASSLMQSLLASGEAVSPVQARMILADRMGGGFSPQQKAVLRTAQNITSAAIFAEKTERSQLAKINALSARTALLQAQGLGLQSNPTPEGRASMLAGIIGIRREVLKLYQEYRVNRRQVPQILRQIAQNTSSLKKEVNDLNIEPEGKGETQNIKAIKTAVKWTALTKMLSWFAKSLTAATARVFGRGLEAMRWQAAYGNSVDWEGIRVRAGLYNISRESAAATDVYASDFAQRMMWGEVSEREIIGLSRAGRWGRMVMSGEAARNPVAANQAFEEMITSSDPAKARSVLRQLGLPLDLMNYRIPVQKGTDTEAAFRANAKLEVEAAKLMWDAANTFQAATEYWSSLEARQAGHYLAQLSPSQEQMYRKRGGTMSFPGQVVSNGAAEQIKQIAVANPLKEENVKPTVNVNTTIYGNANAEDLADFSNKVSETTAKALYDVQVNSMPGYRTGF